MNAGQKPTLVSLVINTAIHVIIFRFLERFTYGMIFIYTLLSQRMPRLTSSKKWSKGL